MIKDSKKNDFLLFQEETQLNSHNLIKRGNTKAKIGSEHGRRSRAQASQQPVRLAAEEPESFQ